MGPARSPRRTSTPLCPIYRRNRLERCAYRAGRPSIRVYQGRKASFSRTTLSRSRARSAIPIYCLRIRTLVVYPYKTIDRYLTLSTWGDVTTSRAPYHTARIPHYCMLIIEVDSLKYRSTLEVDKQLEVDRID
jgi:hypothetical protein